jgi:hypothetical protein
MERVHAVFRVVLRAPFGQVCCPSVASDEERVDQRGVHANEHVALLVGDLACGG